jgi:hypothetical protein
MEVMEVAAGADTGSATALETVSASAPDEARDMRTAAPADEAAMASLWTGFPDLACFIMTRAARGLALTSPRMNLYHL